MTTTIPATSQAWQIFPNLPPSDALFRTPDLVNNLELRTRPVPTPGPNQALVRVHYTSINPRDAHVVASSPFYPIKTVPGLTPCADNSGVIVSVGSSCKSFVPGDRVVIHVHNWLDGDVRNYDLGKNLGGGDVEGNLQEYVVADEERLVRVPDGVRLQDAGIWNTAGLTAVQALMYGHVKAGKGTTVLTMGTGGLSLGAIQVANALGATVIATSSSDEKLQVAKDEGAVHLINYTKTPNWAADVHRLTDGAGVDIVVDVGGAGTLEQSIRAVRSGGIVYACGILTADEKISLVIPLLMGGKTISGIFGAGSKEMLETLLEMQAKTGFRPVVAETFAFNNAKNAFRAFLKQDKAGKIVVEIAREE